MIVSFLLDVCGKVVRKNVNLDFFTEFLELLKEYKIDSVKTIPKINELFGTFVNITSTNDSIIINYFVKLGRSYALLSIFDNSVVESAKLGKIKKDLEIVDSSVEEYVKLVDILACMKCVLEEY